jgi:hypothetical protein
MRWLELTRLRQEPELKPSLAELRRYQRFLLLYPERGSGSEPRERERAQVRLRYAAALARHDREYPLGLARGTLLAQLGAANESVHELSAHLARPQGAVWRLRARNYLLSAAPGVFEEP